MTDFKYRHRKILVSFIYRDPTERDIELLYYSLFVPSRGQCKLKLTTSVNYPHAQIFSIKLII